MLSPSRSSIDSAIPRYSPLTLMVASPLRAAPHDHGRAGHGIGPAQICGDLDILHLPATAFAIVIGVPALAIRADRTGIIRVMAQLANVLDHHVHAVGVTLAQMPARRVLRPLAAEARDAGGDVFPTLSLLAEAVILQLKHGGEGERVIGADSIDVLGSDAGVRPQDVLCVMARDGGNRPVLIVHVH